MVVWLRKGHTAALESAGSLGYRRHKLTVRRTQVPAESKYLILKLEAATSPVQADG